MPAKCRHDLNAPANAQWVRISEIAPREVAGAQTKHFSNLQNAVRYVMEEMRPIDRSVAWITADTGSITMFEIEDLYLNVMTSNWKDEQ